MLFSLVRREGIFKRRLQLCFEPEKCADYVMTKVEKRIIEFAQKVYLNPEPFYPEEFCIII